MKILVVSPFLPYPNVPHTGGKMVFETMKTLSTDHEVHILARVEPQEILHAEKLKPYCTEMYLYTFKTSKNRNPILIAFSYVVLGLKANCLVRKNSYDLVQIEFTETGIAFRKPSIPCVLIAHDVITKPAKRRFAAEKRPLQRTLTFLKFKTTEFIEKYISKKFDMVFTMSEYDRELLGSIDKAIKAEVSPDLIGLDFDVAIDDGRKEPCSLLFLGAMQRDVNVQAVLYFYENILPFIKKDFPDVKFYVVGNSPPSVLQKLAEMDPNLIVTGFVEDMREYFMRTTVFISPLLIGGGIIVKNLQAMSCGLPVVTTSIGNEGIAAVSGRDLFVADRAEEFADRVLELLKDPKLRKRIGDSGREFAQSRFSDDYLMEKRVGFYSDLLKQAPLPFPAPFL